MNTKMDLTTLNKIEELNELELLINAEFDFEIKNMNLQHRKDKRAVISEARHQLTIINEPKPEKIVFDFSQHIVVDI